jgi:hypothetical protein
VLRTNARWMGSSITLASLMLLLYAVALPEPAQALACCQACEAQEAACYSACDSSSHSGGDTLQECYDSCYYWLYEWTYGCWLNCEYCQQYSGGFSCWVTEHGAGPGWLHVLDCWPN